MKRNLLLAGLLLLTASLASGQTLLTENFADTLVPPAGWTIDDHQTNWTARLTENAGSTAPEARFSWSPEFNGTTRLISPEINTSGYTDLTLSFRHFLDDFSGTGYSLQVVTRADSGPWNIAWTVDPEDNIGPELKVVHLNTIDVGSSAFQFALVFTGNSYNLDYWYVDEIVLEVSSDVDAAMSSITTRRYSMGDGAVTARILNMGLQNITSVDVYYQIDDQAEIMQSFSGFNLSLGETSDIEFDDPLALDPGNYMITMRVANVNGGGPDGNLSNDTLDLDLHVASTSVYRRPLFEEFTSSTCGPCASFNSNLFNPFVEENGDFLTLVKYQMSWPSPGDPYYTEEGGERRAYYGVSFVPDLYTDGAQTSTDYNNQPNAVPDAFLASLAEPAFMDLSAYHVIVDSAVTVHLDIMPYFTADVIAYIVVFENVTTGNVGSNGETEFHHVMMKMIPDADGTEISLVDGQLSSVEGTADMSQTFVEEMDDLGVAVFVQEGPSKLLFQSAYSVESQVGIGEGADGCQVRIYPNPSRGQVKIDGLKEQVEIQVFNVCGQKVREVRNFSGTSLDLGGLDNGYYILRMTGQDTMIKKAISIMR